MTCPEVEVCHGRGLMKRWPSRLYVARGGHDKGPSTLMSSSPCVVPLSSTQEPTILAPRESPVAAGIGPMTPTSELDRDADESRGEKKERKREKNKVCLHICVSCIRGDYWRSVGGISPNSLKSNIGDHRYHSIGDEILVSC